MAFCTINSARKGVSQWTPRQNKLFEEALVVYSKETPDRWHNIARAVGGGKTADDVKRYYDLLLEDIKQIESGQVPFPVYRSSSVRGGSNASMAYEEHRLKNLKL
ncbi:protein RADIALIS-like 3 isoform X1 [Carex rostrata]